MTKTSAELELEVEATRGNLDRTVEALRGKMSPGQLVDEVGAVMGEGGRQVISRLGDHARQNPLPLALVGIGVAWMMMGNNRRSNATSDAGYDGHGRERTSLPDKISETFHDITGAVSDAADTAREAVAHKASDVAATMSHLKVDASDRLAQARRSVGARYSETLQSEPLILGAIGLAVGLAAGAAIPASEIEDRYLGGLHDDVVDKVQAFAGEHLHTARDVGVAAYAAAKDALGNVAEGAPAVQAQLDNASVPMSAPSTASKIDAQI